MIQINNFLTNSFSKNDIENVIRLYLEGNTIPFMARYRKEQTGNKTEVEIKEIIDAYELALKFKTRKEYIKNQLIKKEIWSSLIEKELNAISDLTSLESWYSPYKEKKTRKYEKAVSLGIAPKVDTLIEVNVLNKKKTDIDSQINNLIEEYKDLDTEEVKELIVESVKEVIVKNPKVRESVKQIYETKSYIVTKLVDENKDAEKKYKLYYDFTSDYSKIKGHQLLAIEKAKQDGVIKVAYKIEKDNVLKEVSKAQFYKLVSNELLKDAVTQVYSSRLKKSVENELYKELKLCADSEAIEIFKTNLEKLLMTTPIKNKIIMAIDPAYRTGCKIAIIDEQGTLLNVDVIYPHAPKNEWENAKKKIIDLVNKYRIDLIGIGNGTASKETELLVVELMDSIDIPYIIVNESGASVYSASEEARKEFHNLSVEQRSAVSLARRIQNPLAELIKIDPKSLGVGQYQHIVDSELLGDALSFVTMSVVNNVGVDVNTASAVLLQYVSGLNETLANNIVEYREKNGRFTSRKELLKVPKIGSKTYEQCIGFLRIENGKNPLDNTIIHPEQYKEVENMLKEFNIPLKAVGTYSINELNELVKTKNVSTQGKELLENALLEFIDIRELNNMLEFKRNLINIEDLKVGQMIKGTVRSVVSFGGFVDIGLKNDGFIHISKLAKGYITNPQLYINVGDIKEFKILSVDIETKKVTLSLID